MLSFPPEKQNRCGYGPGTGDLTGTWLFESAIAEQELLDCAKPRAVSFHRASQ
jgi:hypothetical protein